MSTVLSLLPLLVLLLLAFTVIRTAVLLATRPMHPWRILHSGLSAATVIAVIGLAGLLPSSSWWAVWLVTLGVVVALGLAGRRALRPVDVDSVPDKRRSLLTPPSRAALIGESALTVALLVLAVVAG